MEESFFMFGFCCAYDIIKDKVEVLLMREKITLEKFRKLKESIIKNY